MNCFFCESENTNNINKNKFMPPIEKTYFTSLDDYKEYYQNKNNSFIPLSQNGSSNNLIKVSNNKAPIVKKERGPLHREIDFVPKDYDNIKYPNLEIKCYSLKNPQNLNNEIILLRIRNKHLDWKKNQENSINVKESYSTISDSNDISGKITLLISHSVSDDLGILFPRLCDIATILKCDVISYDYTGYGCSNNKPNYNSLKNDLIIVLNYCTNTLDLKNENIVLLSFNIGAIPSINASIQPNYCSIRGMILISHKLNFIKKYNYENINEVICPVFIIRGDKNDTIKKKKIISFANKFKESIYWIPKNGHKFEEIMDENRLKFYTKIRKFLTHIQSTRMKIQRTIVESRNSSIIARDD